MKNTSRAKRLYRACWLLLVLTGGVSISSAVAQSSACISAEISAYATSPIVFRTYTELQEGGKAYRYISAQFNLCCPGTCPNWRLTVKATGPFSNGRDQLDLYHTSIQFNTVVGGPSGSSIGIPTNPFPLSLTETTIIPRSNEPLDVFRYPTFDIKYDLIIQGGNALMGLSNGEYQTNLVFNLYDVYGNLLGTGATRIAFQVDNPANYSSTVELQPGADNITMEFNSAEEIANGIRVIQTRGLLVTSYFGHQIIARAATNRLVAGGGGNGLNFLPVSIVRFGLDVYGVNLYIRCYIAPLSTNGHVVADNPVMDYNYQRVYYNLIFSIPSNNPNLSNADPGSYFTSVVLMLVPN